MNFFGYYVLNLDPTILSFIGVAHPTPKWLRPKALIEHVPWWHGATRRMFYKKYRQILIERSGVNYGLMVHARDEDAKRKLLRIKGSFVSQNIYIDKGIFDVLLPIACEKQYQAVYVAQLQPFKRLHLARGLHNVLVVAGDLSNVERYKRVAPNVSFNSRRLEKVEISSVINSAICTLALSRVEGAMLASFESLLCGVPVVSTPSKGGRDVFFNDYNCRIVRPKPKSVAEGVEYFETHRRDPNIIRTRALADLEPHKVRFCSYISDLAVALGGTRIDPGERYLRYFSAPGGLGKFFIWADKFEVASEVERINATAFRG